ncbi:MAG: hypothetical protein ING59_03510, partial [Burkholderiales bacterium]|nr:hypothetical protein [Burkholderiales bacterium]
MIEAAVAIEAAIEAPDTRIEESGATANWTGMLAVPVGADNPVATSRRPGAASGRSVVPAGDRPLPGIGTSSRGFSYWSLASSIGRIVRVAWAHVVRPECPMSSLLSSRSVLVTVVLAACQAAVVANAQTPGAPAAAARQVITSAEQLPRRVIKLDKLPSQYLEAPLAEVLALAAVLEKNLRDDL